MRTTQLFVLGMLARNGPMHGHQIRRQAQLERAEFWGKVKVSSLYAALHRMEAEGLVEAVERTQEGRFPARTVYKITAEGWRELVVLREACFHTTTVEPDPLDLALAFSDDLETEYLCSVIAERLASLRALAESVERQEHQVRQYLAPLDLAVVRHFKLRVAAEVRWHEEFLEQLPVVLSKSQSEADKAGQLGGAPTNSASAPGQPPDTG
jgi:DNA-binding PadR family transcriptional regulator